MQRSIRPDGGGSCSRDNVFRFHVFEGGSSKEELSSLFTIVQSLCVFTIVPFVFESFETLKEKRDGTTADKEEEIRR